MLPKPSDKWMDTMKETVAFQDFGSHFKVGSTSTEYLRIFRHSCRL